MKRAIIFANGLMDRSTELSLTKEALDMVIAADGGLHNCELLGLHPDVIIGDLDSLQANEINQYRHSGVKVIQHPTQKDETDLELALQYALKCELREVIIFGALGARWDMTVANILLMASPLFSPLDIRLVDGDQELVLIRPGEPMLLNDRIGDPVSLIPLAGDARGVVTEGLEYPLNGETLFFGSPRGVSNKMIQAKAHVSIHDGLLLCVVRKERFSELASEGRQG